jgi:hypothetical protein
MWPLRITDSRCPQQKRSEKTDREPNRSSDDRQTQPATSGRPALHHYPATRLGSEGAGMGPCAFEGAELSCFRVIWDGLLRGLRQPHAIGPVAKSRVHLSNMPAGSVPVTNHQSLSGLSTTSSSWRSVTLCARTPSRCGSALQHLLLHGVAPPVPHTVSACSGCSRTVRGQRLGSTGDQRGAQSGQPWIDA